MHDDEQGDTPLQRLRDWKPISVDRLADETTCDIDGQENAIRLLAVLQDVVADLTDQVGEPIEPGGAAIIRRSEASVTLEDLHNALCGLRVGAIDPMLQPQGRRKKSLSVKEQRRRREALGFYPVLRGEKGMSEIEADRRMANALGLKTASEFKHWRKNFPRRDEPK